MKRIVSIACLLSCCLAGRAFAQWPLAPLAAPRTVEDKQAHDKAASRHTPSMSQANFGQLEPTPAMWFYEQARKQYENPKAAVRANAEFRNTQRINRMAAREYYGISVSRPANVAAPAYSPLTSPVYYGAVPRTTVINVNHERPLGWR